MLLILLGLDNGDGVKLLLFVCVSGGHLQAAYNISKFAEYSTRLQWCRPASVHVLTCSIWQHLHGNTFYEYRSYLYRTRINV